ncbi:MAG TPA: substrate-binding domain-containing protein [Alphaproteobacteria bacterium]|jgi:ribose transport system substrate-binding protein|nr:substrate-binding domain-containing protein [Alphaproteobacteria bacterium]
MNAMRAILLSVVGLMVAGGAMAEDRLLGMVEPVKAKKAYRVAYASADMNADFWLGMAYGVTDEAKEAGVNIVRITSAGGYGKVAEQIGQLEQLGALDLDAVILSSAAFDGYDKVVERLTAKGTKVIVLGTPIGSPKASLGIMQNEGGIGQSIGSYICGQNPKATVITLPGPAGSAWNKLRFDGFKEATAKCPGVKLVGNTFAGNIAIEDGQRQAADLLTKYPNADYIYAVAGIFSVGVAQQARRMKSHAKIVTGTLTRRTVELIKDGSMAMVVSEPAIVFGRAAVQYTVRLLNGDDLPKMVPGIMPYPVALIPNVALTAANVDKHDINKYDLPPEGWRPAQLQ